MPYNQAVTLIHTFKSLLQWHRTKEITLSPDRVESSAYLRWLLLSVILISACSSSSLAFHMMHFPSDSAVNNLHAMQEMWVDVGSTPGPGWAPGEGNDNPLQYSCLGNRMDRGVWWATVHGVIKSSTQFSISATTTTIQLKVSEFLKKWVQYLMVIFLFISVNNCLSFWLFLSLLSFLGAKSNLFPNS